MWINLSRGRPPQIYAKRTNWMFFVIPNRLRTFIKLVHNESEANQCTAGGRLVSPLPLHPTAKQWMGPKPSTGYQQTWAWEGLFTLSWRCVAYQDHEGVAFHSDFRWNNQRQQMFNNWTFLYTPWRNMLWWKFCWIEFCLILPTPLMRLFQPMAGGSQLEL